MKLYQEWMTDNEHFGDDYSNNVLLEDAKRRFEVQKQSLEGKDALVDGISERIVVQNHTNPLNQSKYDKKISYNTDSNVHTGSIVEFDDKKWLVVSKIFDKQAYKVGSVLECNNSITFYYKSGISWVSAEIPIVIDSNIRLYSMGEDDGKFISVPDTNIIVRMANNEITSKIKRDDVFKIGTQNYKVVDVSDIIKVGLLVLKMEFNESEQVVPENDYSILILNGEEVTLYGGESSTLQLNVQCKLEGVIVDNPIVTYASSNELCCTVDDTGLVTTTGTGSSIITVTYGNSTDTIKINSLMSIEDKFEIIISPSDTSIYTNKTKTFTASVTNNGVDMPYHGVDWSLVNVDGTNNVYCTYTISGRDITIIAKNIINKSIRIRATLSVDENVYKEQIITIRSLL